VLGRIAALLSRLAERWVPSAFTIAVLLTCAVAGTALSLTAATPRDVLVAWGEGFWTLNPFAMQMALVVLTGYLVSTSPAVDRLFVAVARHAGSPRRTVTLMAAVSMGVGWVHWGLGLIGSAMLLRHLARAQPRVDYRLLVASAYLGMGAIWHGGLSGSAPLLVATPGHFLERTIGLVPVTATIFSPFNLVLVLVVFVVMLAATWAMHPADEDAVTVAPEALEAMERFVPPARPAAPPPAARLEYSRVLPLALGACGVAWLAWYFATRGAALTLDVLNFAFLMAAVLLHPHVASLVAAGDAGARLLAGVVLQFPLYAGMYGIIQGTGLARVLGEAIATHATADTLPVLLYWYSSVLNYFVPSGGSKWAVEAPFLVEAAARLGVGVDRVVIAYAWGDMASNLIQPFWALPLLAAARLGFRDVMGYAFLSFALITLVVSTAFALWPTLW
jgi:short-chain fatty acids transporter